MSDSKPCPNCGHCPMCGHTPPKITYPWPNYPNYPWGTATPPGWWQQPVTVTWTSSSTTEPTTGALASSN